MDEAKTKYGYNFFEEFYKNSMQRNETFSKVIGEEIEKEFKKMSEQYNEWLKKKNGDIYK